MSKTKKTKILTSAVAVVMAAMLLVGGGTIAYLNSSTEEVTNNFNANQVKVDIEESGEGQYDIIPGTSQEKDPTVTVEASVDSYVFLVVEDNTDELVKYDIISDWTLLSSSTDDETGATTYVYYQKVDGSNEAQVLGVLEGNEVSYDSTLTNENMLDDNGELKADLTLSFKAYAIQAEPFNDPALAYKALNPTDASDSSTLTEALASGGVIILSNDISLTSLNVSEDTYIDLNGNTLTVIGTQNLTDDVSLTLANGTLSTTGAAAGIVNLGVNGNSTLTLSNVEYTTEGSGICVYDNGTVNIENSTLKSTGYYLVDTEASNASDYSVTINIKNSTLTQDDEGKLGVAVLMNVPGTLTIENSTISGSRLGVFVRAGSATITDTTISNDWSSSTNTSLYTSWSSGTAVPPAALVVGNQKGTYKANADVTLTNVTINESEESAAEGYTVPKVLISANSTYTATLTVNGGNVTESDIVKDSNGTASNITVTINSD